MSHNRRMFGGRPGGPMGPQLNVSPWEGGVVPGQPRPQAGILGAAPQPMNLLSNLSTQEAQLALASNLLSSLLGQQQQQQQIQANHPPVPPPLLGMNTSMPGRPGFFPRPDGMKPMGGGPMRSRGGYMGSRFPDMYKNQQGQRGLRPNAPLFKRQQGSVGGPRQQRGKMQGRDSDKGSPSKKTGVKKEDEKEEDESMDADREESEKKGEDDDAGEGKDDEDEEGKGGRKREWKDEKNKKDGLGMDTDDTESGGAQKGKAVKSETKSDESRYKDIPKELLVCHICNKNMWDGQSFENHLRGKSHQMMMDQTEKSYKVQVKLMRQELKLAEEKREIELERVQRLGKKVNVKSREYCTMCDLYFFGNIMGHRKNQLHQNLKNFLHPRCRLCSQEFPSRTEWDHHQLTLLHLQKMVEQKKNEGKEASEKGVVVEGKEGEEGAVGEGEGEGGGAEGSEGEGAGGAGGEGEARGTVGAGAGTEGDGAGAAGAVPEGSPPPAGDRPSPAAAAVRRMPGGRVSVPAYDPKKVYGVQLLKKVVGYTCDVCNRFFFQHKEALAHCQTVAHYKNYMSHMMRNAPVVKKEKDKDDGEVEKKRVKKEGEGEEAPTDAPAQEHSADSTTESEAAAAAAAATGGGPAEGDASAAAGETPAAPAAKSDENGTVEGDAGGDTAQADDSADDNSELGKADGEGEEAVEEEKDDKKLSSPSRRGVRRGVGRGRGHRRR